jgi:hypothetical protein
MALRIVSEFLETTVPFCSATSSMLRSLKISYAEGGLDDNHDQLGLCRVGGCSK